jgi:uncharacterized membrane protein SpoIIM required for sporulation
MVLESLLNPKAAEKREWYVAVLDVFVLTVVYTCIAVFFAWRIFPSEASILSIAFITILFVPFFQRVFRIEEKKELVIKKKWLTKEWPVVSAVIRHSRPIIIYSSFFLGVIIAMTAIYVFVPQMNVFGVQEDVLKTLVNDGISGNVTGSISFMIYFFNNSQTMLLAFILSIMFGTGAVFILSWNASIISVFLGRIVVEKMSALGMGSGAAFLHGVPAGLGAIALHGIPEIVGYFFAGLAGGILSVGIIKETYGTPEFWQVSKDAVLFLVIGELLIILGAWLEVVF